VHGFTCVKQPGWVDVKKSGGVGKPESQGSRNQSHERCARKGQQALGAFGSFCLETVLMPFWGAAMRIMTGILRASQATPMARMTQNRCRWGRGPEAASG